MKTSSDLNANDQLTQLVRHKNIFTWQDLAQYVKQLPYGRTANRKDLSLVLTEQKGTCSSKHAFLKHIADLNNVPNIKLILSIFKMNTKNTPKIGNVLIENKLEYMPEAHCYLSVDGEYIDYTSPNFDFKTIKKDIIQEQEIEPFQVAEFKVDFHKKFIKNWIEAENIPFNFEEIWRIREVCINNMSR